MKKINFILLGLLMLGITACEEEKPPVQPNDPDHSISFTINHTVGDQEFAAGTEYLVGNNDNVTFSRYAYMLGSFYLTTSDGDKIALDSQYALIEAHKGMTTFTLMDVPFGDYSSIGFSIGLDSAINHGNPNQYPSGHPLSAVSNSLHWGWVGGYIFTAIEGKDVDAGESIIFHLAGVQNKIDFNFATDFTHGTSGSKVELGYDIAEVFVNPNTFSLVTDGRSTHTVDHPTTTKLIQNMADVFTLTKVSAK